MQMSGLPTRAREEIALMSSYHSPQIDVDVRLNTNESPYPPPESFVDSVVKSVQDINWNRYPDRQATELRRHIAARHSVTEECVFVANGSNEVLQTLLLAYGAAGRTVVIFEPTYMIHGHLARIAGSVLVSGERGKDYTLNSEEASNLITRVSPALTFLCSPNNPTGITEQRETVEKVLEAVRSVGGLLCVDEAYGEFAAYSALEILNRDAGDRDAGDRDAGDGGDGDVCCGGLRGGLRGGDLCGGASCPTVDVNCPMVVTRTYSKAWSMAAARLGYLVGPPWVVDELEKVVLPYHLDSVKQALGIAALEHEDAMRRRVDKLIAGRAQIISGLSALDVHVWRSDANFVLFRPLNRDGSKVWHELVDRSVLVRNCSSWPRFDGCLRVTVGTTIENEKFLSALAEIV